MDLDEEEIECALDEENTQTEALSKYRVGPYIIIPTMSGDDQSRVHVLAAVGFVLEKTLEVVTGHCSCEALVFLEDQSYTAERGVLIACQDHALNWNILLS